MRAKNLILLPLLLTASHAATLLGHWKFDQTMGTAAADEVGSNAGTINSGVTVGSTGIVGNAFSFDGTNAGNVTMGNATFLSTILHGSGSSTNSYSFSAWVNPSSDKGSVVFAGDDDDGSAYTNIGTNGNSVRRWVRGAVGLTALPETLSKGLGPTLSFPSRPRARRLTSMVRSDRAGRNEHQLHLDQFGEPFHHRDP